MPVAHINGVELYYELTRSGEPVVLVHGSWGDHHNWDRVVSALAESFSVPGRYVELVRTFARRG